MSKVKNIINKSVKTLKNEGPVSLGKKTFNYFKYNLLTQEKIIYGDILIINGCTLPHPERYRVDHQVEQLRAYGLYADKIFYENLTKEKMKYYRGFIFFRCPITDNIKQFISEAKAENKAIFFDIDDLVIDQKYTDTIEFVKNMKPEDKKEYDDGVNRMKETLKLCDYAITTTEKLQDELKNYTEEVFINRNVLSEKMVELSLEAIAKKEESNDIVMGYLSGSITHNPDVELIKPIIVKLLKKYKNLKLKLAGEIDLPEELKQYSEQIIIEPFVNWEKLPDVIASLDINLAPLEKSIFNEAKSENKWTEAAICKVVTVASNVGAFAKIINDKEDGFLCNNENEWEKTLSKLIEDKELRNQIANNAYKKVIKDHITTYSGHKLAKFIRSKLARNIAFVLPTTNISGGVNVVIKHINILKNQGNDVFVINMDEKSEDIDSKWGTVKVISTKKLKIEGHLNTMVASLWATLDYVKKTPTVKNKMYLVQNYETDFASFGKYMRIEANRTYEDDTTVKYLTISKWCEDWLNERFEKKCSYAPNGIDLNQFQYKERNFDSKIKILIEGNSDDYYKNVDESFKIVEKLDKEKFEIRFLSYQGKPKNWYYVDKFMHKVPYKEVGKVYQDSDILLKTSILESFSYPPLEMMATGGLVVVAPNGGNIEYIKDNENCLFYNQGKIEEAVEKIIELKDNKKLRDKLIKEGLKTAKNREWDKIEKEIINLYKED